MTTSLLTVSTAAEPSSPHAAAAVWLEIKLGRTLFPRRPVLTERFLIGAGSNCQLQLGGEGMPFLHSLLAIDSSGVSIEAFVPWPELSVNEQKVRTAQLCDGDEVTIGPFQFTIHLQTSLETDTTDPLYAPIPLELAHEETAEEDLAGLSAAELIDRLEAMEAEIDLQETAERRGAAALMDAILQQADGDAAAPAESPLSDSDALLQDLSALSQDLEQRLMLLREREQEQADRAETLLTAQARLAEQLELAARSLASEEARMRASA